MWRRKIIKDTRRISDMRFVKILLNPGIGLNQSITMARKSDPNQTLPILDLVANHHYREKQMDCWWACSVLQREPGLLQQRADADSRLKLYLSTTIKHP
jgi:hypothetical protein